MAYACPVCDEPQVDAEHLANHVAFTAIGGDADHEAWLDANAPEWGQLGQGELAEIVADHAEETEFPVDVEAGSSGGHAGGSHDHSHGDGVAPPPSAAQPDDLDEDAQDVLAEARELTKQMREDGTDDDSTGDEADADRSDSETQ